MHVSADSLFNLYMLTKHSASYAALVRMPYVETFRDPDFLCKSTLWKLHSVQF